MKELTKENFMVHISEVPTKKEPKKMYRYNGGWAKTVTGIDTAHLDGYSLKGEFIDNSTTGEYLVSEGTLYLDCDIQGSRKNKVSHYRLFTMKKGELWLMAETTNQDNRTWAVDLWPKIEEFLNLKFNPLAEFSTEQLQEEIDRRKKKESK